MIEHLGALEARREAASRMFLILLIFSVQLSPFQMAVAALLDAQDPRAPWSACLFVRSD